MSRGAYYDAKITLVEIMCRNITDELLILTDLQTTDEFLILTIACYECFCIKNMMPTL